MAAEVCPSDASYDISLHPHEMYGRQSEHPLTEGPWGILRPWSQFTAVQLCSLLVLQRVQVFFFDFGATFFALRISRLSVLAPIIVCEIF